MLIPLSDPSFERREKRIGSGGGGRGERGGGGEKRGKGEGKNKGGGKRPQFLRKKESDAQTGDGESRGKNKEKKKKGKEEAGPDCDGHFGFFKVVI